MQSLLDALESTLGLRVPPGVQNSISRSKTMRNFRLKNIPEFYEWAAAKDAEQLTNLRAYIPSHSPLTPKYSSAAHRASLAGGKG